MRNPLSINLQLAALDSRTCAHIPGRCGIVFAAIVIAAQFDVSAAPLANNEPASVSGDYIHQCWRGDV
jgi:hypothetical protein